MNIEFRPAARTFAQILADLEAKEREDIEAKHKAYLADGLERLELEKRRADQAKAQRNQDAFKDVPVYAHAGMGFGWSKGDEYQAEADSESCDCDVCTSTEEPPIEAGDMVMLRSGGPAMTVVAIDSRGPDAQVMWHIDNGALVSATVPARFLERIG